MDHQFKELVVEEVEDMVDQQLVLQEVREVEEQADLDLHQEHLEELTQEEAVEEQVTKLPLQTRMVDLVDLELL